MREGAWVGRAPAGSGSGRHVEVGGCRRLEHRGVPLLCRRQPLFRAGAWRRAAASVAGSFGGAAFIPPTRARPPARPPSGLAPPQARERSRRAPPTSRRPAAPFPRHPPRPRPAASPRTERSAARRRRRASPRRHACPHLASRALCGGAERVSLAQTEQRPRQRSLLRPSVARGHILARFCRAQAPRARMRCDAGTLYRVASVCAFSCQLPCGATSAAPRKRGALLRPPSPSSRPGPALAPPTQSAVAPRLNQHPSRGHAGPCGVTLMSESDHCE